MKFKTRQKRFDSFHTLKCMNRKMTLIIQTLSNVHFIINHKENNVCNKIVNRNISLVDSFRHNLIVLICLA